MDNKGAMNYRESHPFFNQTHMAGDGLSARTATLLCRRIAPPAAFLAGGSYELKRIHHTSHQC